MPAESRPEKESKPIDARARIRNSEKSGRWFTVLFWAIGLGGLGFCYWFYTQVYVPGEKEKLHLAQTQAYARELRGAIAALDEWSAQRSFDSVRAELVKFDKREDADLAIRRQLWDQFGRAYEPRAERMREFEALMRELEAFPLDSGKDRLLAMQERMRLASGQFEKPLMTQLKEAWEPKRKEVADRLGLHGSAGTGAIEVRSVPSGATLYLNDREVGVTPLQASGIKAGPLKLSLKHPKYYDFNYPVEIKEYGVLSLNDLQMKPRQGGIEISVMGVPTSALVEVELGVIVQFHLKCRHQNVTNPISVARQENTELCIIVNSSK